MMGNTFYAFFLGVAVGFTLLVVALAIDRVWP